MSQNPQIIYAVVVRGSNVVLSEYTTATGNFIAFAKTIISKVITYL
jgi:vesicle-associated membrane protein 7